MDNASFFTQRRLPQTTPAQVFAAFADPTRLARWWGPAGFSNRFQVFEFQPGGRWEFVMVGPDGTEYANRSVFAELRPPQRVVIEHRSQPHFTLTVVLTAEGPDTVIAWTQAFESASVAQSVRHIVEPANEENLDRLQTVLGSPGPVPNR